MFHSRRLNPPRELRGSISMAFATTLALVFVGVASANEGAHAHCGSHAFPRFPDAAYETAYLPRTRPAADHKVGDTEQLWIYDLAAKKLERVTFTYRAVSAKSYVIVDDQWWSGAPDAAPDAALVDPGDVARLTEVFERNAGPSPGLGKGIYELLTTAYAPVSPVGGDGKVYIAVTEIKSNVSGGYVVGYVSPNDRIAPETYQYSNYRNLVVLDATRRTSDLQRETTLSHEFEHVLHNGTDRNEHRWIDEGLAVFSQTVCGYAGNSGREFFKDTNIGLFDQSGIPTIADYDKAYLIMQFIADHYGIGVLGEIVRSDKHGISGVDGALQAQGYAARFANDVFPAWAVANLLAPDAISSYAYRTYDPRPNYSSDFGDAGQLPIQESKALTSFGVRYVRSPSNWAQGEVTTTSGLWMRRSVEGVPGPDVSVREWADTGGGRYRDCSFAGPWLVIGPVSSSSSAYPYALNWQTPSVAANPVIADRFPVGSNVDPITDRIRARFENLDPGLPLTVQVTSGKLGLLTRSLDIVREPLLGRCGETVRFEDESVAPLPGDDIITVNVSALTSPVGGTLSESQASWHFETGAGDTEPPLVTIGLLANPVLPAHLTAVVLSNEPLYPNDDGAVRLVVNGTTLVTLTAKDASKKQWVGTITLPGSGEYGFHLRATDLAGNRPADPYVTYAAVIGDDATAATAKQTAAAR